jgi:hypothetical protein
MVLAVDSIFEETAVTSAATENMISAFYISTLFLCD